MSFNLATSVSELRGTEYVNRRVIQIPSTREINNGNFFRSDQAFRFNIAGNTWWSPSQSYFKIRCSLKKITGQPLTAQNALAPSFCFMDCMYRSATFSMNNIRVSQINDYLPQISALKHRHGKSKDYRRGVGNSLAFYDTDFNRRQARVICDGEDIDDAKYALYSDTDLSYAAADTLSLATTAGNKGTVSIIVGAGGLINPSLIPDDIIYCSGVNAGGVAVPTQAVRVLGQSRNGGDAAGSISRYNVESVTTDAISPFVAAPMNANNFKLKRRVSKKAECAGNFECVWMPPLGVSDCSHYLPAGQYEYVLSPQQAETAYNMAIETTLAADPRNGVDYNLTMDSIELYVVTVEQARVDSLDYLLDLKEISCVPFTLTTNTWTSNMLVVPPSTSRLSVAYQDTRVSTSSRYPTTKFIADANVQNLIERFNITYANVIYPSNDLDLKFNDIDTTTPLVPANAVARISRFTSAYNDMLLANGSAFSDTTSENLREWVDNGFYLSYPTFKEAKDTSTQVVVKQSFSAVVPNTQLLLFASYSTITSVSIKSGQVVSVSTVEA